MGPWTWLAGTGDMDPAGFCPACAWACACTVFLAADISSNLLCLHWSQGAGSPLTLAMLHAKHTTISPAAKNYRVAISSHQCGNKQPHVLKMHNTPASGPASLRNLFLSKRCSKGLTHRWALTLCTRLYTLYTSTGTYQATIRPARNMNLTHHHTSLLACGSTLIQECKL